MDYYDIIATNFQATIETIADSVDRLVEPIELASHLMVRALLQDNKIVACGNGVDAALAMLFSSNLLSRFEQERPALPALALGSDSASVTAIASSNNINEIYSRQLRALGQPGDVLLCINSAGHANNLSQAVQAAHERNMTVVALSNLAAGELSTLLNAEDVQVQVEAGRRPRVVEMHTMIIHSLCELIDHTLFGPYNQD